MRTDPLHYLKLAFEQWLPGGRIPEFNVRPVIEGDIVEMLKKNKKSHAFGDDQIDAATVKIASTILARPIAYVVNLFLSTSEFVQKWKLGRILPLLKNSECNPQEPKSFCPVSQLSLISKLAERNVQTQLLEHLESTGQLNGDHHAYRRWTSITTALLQMTDIIATGTDENTIAASMGIDLTAAFDCMEYCVLMDKLKFYKIGKPTLDWIQSYLDGRSSYVAVGSGKSRYHNIEHGVPQVWSLDHFYI